MLRALWLTLTVRMNVSHSVSPNVKRSTMGAKGLCDCYLSAKTSCDKTDEFGILNRDYAQKM